MKCRARMCDQSPVTFEFHDRGNREFGIGIYVTELIGEGFFVRIVCPRDAPRTRDMVLREALDCAGVDTATVEYWDAKRCHVGAGPHNLRPGIWVPLFPPVLREEPASIDPGILTYMRTPAEQEVLRLSKMLSAECAMTKELQRRLQDRAEPTWFMINTGAEVLASAKYRDESMRETLAAIWRAMEKAR